MKRHHAKQSGQQRGLTLVELMVSMAIGLVVIGAVFVNYLNSSVGSRQSAALMQVTDDASLALGILRNHIAMAGYSQPTGVSATGGMTRGLAGLAIFGCNGGFATTSGNIALDPGVIACANTAGAPDSLLIRYEADGSNTPTVKVGSLDVPSDCIGVGLTAVGTVFTADNRFRIDAANDQFECRGNGGASPAAQPLLDNISDMQITYGVGVNNAATGQAGQRAVRYVRADQIGLITDTAAQRQANWNNVISVRICLLVRSSKEVLTQKTRYRDCAGTLVAATAVPDLRIYRAFTTTIALNNRISSAPPPP